MPKTHDVDQLIPRNKLQRLAFAKGIRSASAFAEAISKAGIAARGSAYYKWDGRAGNTQYNKLLAIARFLGANSVEEVFDP